MAAQPLTYLEQKWASGYSNNRLVQAATQKPDRQIVPCLDIDIYRSITPLGRQTLLSLGRWLYMNVPAYKAAADEIARYLRDVPTALQRGLCFLPWKGLVSPRETRH